MNDASSAPWANPPRAPVARNAPDGGTGEVARAPWAEPPELVAVRADVRKAQERVDRAIRELKLAAELEGRLQAQLEGQPGQGAPSPPSPERQAAELEATAILLKAELRAAKILNDSGSSDRPGSYGPAAINLGAASALEVQLAQLADIEVALAEIGERLVREDLSSKTGQSRLAFDSGEARRRARPIGQSVPVPFFRRPRRGNPA